MIKFRCSKCGKSYKAPDNYIGKALKCKKCGHHEQITADSVLFLDEDPHEQVEKAHETAEILKLAQAETHADNVSDKTSIVESYRPLEEYPPPTLISRINIFSDTKRLLIVGGIVIVVLLVCLLMFRDTWEVDNFDKIIQLEKEADQYVNEKSFENAIIKYNELFALINDNTLVIDTLTRRVDRARISSEEVKALYENRLHQSCISLIQEADELEKQENYQGCVVKLRDANDIASTDIIDSQLLRTLAHDIRDKIMATNSKVMAKKRAGNPESYKRLNSNIDEESEDLTASKLLELELIERELLELELLYESQNRLLAAQTSALDALLMKQNVIGGVPEQEFSNALQKIEDTTYKKMSTLDKLIELNERKLEINQESF